MHPDLSLRGHGLSAVLSLPSLPAHGGQPPNRRPLLVPQMPQALHVPWRPQQQEESQCCHTAPWIYGYRNIAVFLYVCNPFPTGYSTPLKEVPPEKFNITAIPKGYRSPWHGHMGDEDKAVGSENRLPMKLPHGDFVNFNR